MGTLKVRIKLRKFYLDFLAAKYGKIISGCSSKSLRLWSFPWLGDVDADDSKIK